VACLVGCINSLMDCVPVFTGEMYEFVGFIKDFIHRKKKIYCRCKIQS
jgi:hypothetical protein